MARFCTKCGAGLAEGQVCGCSGSVAQPGVNSQPQVPPVRPTQPGVNTQAVPAQGQPYMPQGQPYMAQPQGQPYSAQASYFTNLFSFLFDSIKKPATSIKNILQKRDQGLAWGFIAIFAVAFTVFMFTMINSAMGLIARMLPFGGMFGFQYDVPYAKVFFCSIIMSAAFTVLIAVTSLMYIKIFNKSFDFSQALCFAGFVTIPMSIALLLGSLFIFVFELLGMLIFSMGILLATIFSFIGFKYAHNWDDDKFVYMFACYNITYTVFSTILLFIILRILS